MAIVRSVGDSVAERPAFRTLRQQRGRGGLGRARASERNPGLRGRGAPRAIHAEQRSLQRRVMTIPWMMNCPHAEDGWCLECVVRMGNENAALREQTVRMREPEPRCPECKWEKSQVHSVCGRN